MAISVSQRSSEGKPIWPWLITLGSFFLAQYVVKLGLRCKSLPEKRELEALRATLAEEL